MPLKFAGVALACGLLGPSVLQSQSQVFVVGNALPMQTRINNVAINGVIGSATGLVWATIRHSSKWKGATKGAAGGILISVGKQIASTAFDGSGFLGREVSAVGTSLAVSPGAPTTMSFPIGPLSVEYGEGSWDWRINTADAIATARYAISSHTQFDLRRSLSSGAPVFRDDRVNLGFDSDFRLTGVTGFGTIRLSRRAFETLPGRVDVLYHENVHILQEDYLDAAVALPVERKAIEHLPFGRRFLRHFDAGALGPMIVGGVSHFIPYDSRPWEREAYALTANLYY